MAEPTHPGHRKILGFFLVDPKVSILSTARVPPQQFSWWVQELSNVFADVSIPPEIVEHIASFIENDSKTDEQAEKYRKKIRKHRNSIQEFRHPWGLHRRGRRGVMD